MPRYILGIDIGATKISTGLVSMTGTVVTERKFPTSVRSGTAGVISRIVAAVETYPRKAFTGIGVGIMGAVDWHTGVSRGADKLPRSWRNIPLGQRLQRHFGVPATIDNDANAFTFGAALKEAADYRVVVGLTLGSGIGGGMVIDKKLFHSHAKWVGEWGHTVIDMHSSIACTCGGYGHLETVASGWGIEKLYRAFTKRTADPYEIERRVRRGERAAQKVFSLMTAGLGAALANIIAVLNPDAICIGGGLSRFRGYVDGSRKVLKQHLKHRPIFAPPILQITRPETANIRGAALLSQEKFHL